MKIQFKFSEVVAMVTGPVWLLLVVFASGISPVISGPLNIEGPSHEVANNSLTDFDLPPPVSSKGCRYKAMFYGNSEEVSTDEPCLHCQCKGTVVVCKLRICPEIPDPPPPGCIVVHKAKSCCSQLICQQENTKKISREQRFPTNQISNETLYASVSNETKDSAGYCVLDGTVYAEGSAMRSSTLCEYCFCIRGEMKCSSPQCVIPLNGCKPKFRSYACCPTNYDCGESNETAVLKTIPSSTQVPQFLKGCLVNNQFVPEGEPVLPVQLTTGFNTSAGAEASSLTTMQSSSSSVSSMSSATNLVCQTCFCMGGVVHCQPLECDRPIDGCEPIKEDGHCCPDRYDCSKPKKNIIKEVIGSEKTTFEVPTTTEEIGVTTEEEQVVSEKMNDGFVPVAITMVDETGYEDEGEATTTEVTTLRNQLSERKGDSFERIATIIGGSSEESTSIIPPTPTTVITGGKGNTEPKKKSRVSTTTVGGFKNRSDLGSREERRSKDGDELKRLLASSKQNQQMSTEDDEKEEEYFGYPVFETTLSNDIVDNLGGATTEVADSDIIPEDTTSGQVETESESLVVANMQDGEDPSATENNLIGEPDLRETTIVPRYLDNDLVTTLATEAPPSSVETTEALTPSSSSSLAPMDLSSSDNPSSSTLHPTSSISTSTSGQLEFIPFVEEDARVHLDNDTASSSSDSNPHQVQSSHESHETDAFDKLTHGVTSLLKPLLLKFFNATTEESYVAQGSTEIRDDHHALPILVEKDIEDSPPQTEFNLSSGFGGGATFNLGSAGSSSLYSNGFYPHGSIIQDDDEGPIDDLHVSEGKVDKDQDQVPEDIPTTYRPPPPPPTLPSTKKPEQPLKSISSIDKFIPSYAPATVPQTNAQPLDSHPSRTYSKFGIQDAPLYRYDSHGIPIDSNSNSFGYLNNAKKPTTTAIYHHRYYNEPEEIPTSRIQNPYNFYSTNPNIKNAPTSGTPTTGQQGILGMLPPQIYKNNQFFYEDSSAALDSYEDYDTFIHPPTAPGGNSIASTPPTNLGVTPPRKIFSTSTSSSIPKSSIHGDTGSTNFQFLGERVRMPSYNQQRATSTPKYKYAYVNSPNRGGGSTPTSSSYYFQNKLMTTERTSAAAAAALPVNDYKPFQAPFPFNLPRGQDDDNNLLKSLGIKLSGCNVVGKMYSVGEIIEELSSDCLRCMCSDIGVHCAERKC